MVNDYYRNESHLIQFVWSIMSLKGLCVCSLIITFDHPVLAVSYTIRDPYINVKFYVVFASLHYEIMYIM